MKVETAFEALGTWNEITLYGQDAEKLKSVSCQIKKKVYDLNERFSIFNANSEISKRNAGINTDQDSDEMKHLLKTADYFFKESDGSFNVVSGSLTVLWKKALKDGIIPKNEEILAAKRLMNEEKRIDLGAIVKGYALDEAAKIARQNDVTDFMLNFGGAVYVAGKSRIIGIQNPKGKKGDYCCRLSIKNQAVVTAGIYEQYFEKSGVIYHHIIDTKTGYPSQSGLISATVIGDSAEKMDALSTTVLLCGIEEGIPLIRAHKAAGILITAAGEIYATENIKEMIYEV